MLKTNRYLKRFFCFLLTICLSFTFVLAGCGETTTPPEPEKTVKSISVSKEPTKTEYFVGEEFTVEGGEISVKYSDDTTETKKMTDEGVTISEVNITVSDDSVNTQDKTVTVRYGGKSTTFSITVSYKMHKVTFVLGYEGAKNDVKEVRNGSPVAKPADPTRENFKFENWFADTSLTQVYDFNKAITEDTSIYAKWLDVSVKYFKVSFNYNYTGAADGPTQQVKEGEKVTKPTVDPTRKGYAFKGWFIDAAGTAAFDFDAPLRDEVTIFAKWEKTSEFEGKNTFVFEAEDVNLLGLTGPGFSGTASDIAMILNLPDSYKASNNRAVGYLYEIGLGINFAIISDANVSDAKIVLRLSAEFRDYDMTPDDVSITLNNKAISYPKISFKNVPKADLEGGDTSGWYLLPFEDYVIIEGATLLEGRNTVQITVLNENALTGTTMTSFAPLIDCLKIETTAVLDWDAKAGLPKKNY